MYCILLNLVYSFQICAILIKCSSGSKNCNEYTAGEITASIQKIAASKFLKCLCFLCLEIYL